MDPDAALAAILADASDFVEGATAHLHEDEDPVPTVGLELALAVLALDEWLRTGGFLPQRWTERRTTS